MSKTSRVAVRWTHTRAWLKAVRQCKNSTGCWHFCNNNRDSNVAYAGSQDFLRVGPGRRGFTWINHGLKVRILSHGGEDGAVVVVGGVVEKMKA